MPRALFLSCTLVLLAACQKTGNNPPVTPTGTGNFYISTDTAIGAARPSHSPDTFLIHLKNPAKVAAVPVVLHVPAGGQPDQGTKVNDSTWLDTVNLSQNAVPVVHITTGGTTVAYGVAFEYVITNYWTNSLGRLAPESMYINGDTLWVGSENGLYYSTDNGVNFTNVPALTAAVAAHSEQAYVNGIYASGSTLYTTVLGGVYISRDGGNSFSEHDFTTYTPTLITEDPLNGLFVQGDTLYIAADHGICISRDKGLTYIDDSTVLPHFAVPTGIWAQGSNIYMSTWQGVAISTDGGVSFTLHTNGLGTINNLNSTHCAALCVENGTIYAGTLSGLSISTDNGMTFSTVGTPNGMGGNQIGAIAAAGKLVCAGTNGGLSISTDGGATFINLSSANGLANDWAQSVAISGTTIFVGCQDENGGSPVVPGGLSVVTPRQ